MWWNILPGFIIILGSVAVPGYGLWWCHYFIVGNHYRRTLLERWNRANYQRDARLSGSPYKVLGLETIPDEPEPKNK